MIKATLWTMPEQLVNLNNPCYDRLGASISIRKAPGGNFTQPLFTLDQLNQAYENGKISNSVGTYEEYMKWCKDAENHENPLRTIPSVCMEDYENRT